MGIYSFFGDEENVLELYCANVAISWDSLNTPWAMGMLSGEGKWSTAAVGNPGCRTLDSEFALDVNG